MNLGLQWNGELNKFKQLLYQVCAKGRIWAWNAIGCAHTWYCYTTTHNCCTQTNYTLITVKLNIIMMIVTLVMHLECCLQQTYIG